MSCRDAIYEMLHSARGRLLDSQDWLLGAVQDGPEAGILADPVTLIHVWGLMLQSALFFLLLMTVSRNRIN